MEEALDRFFQLCRFRYLGLGFLWAWIYCLWFSPAIFVSRQGIGVNASISWILSCVTVMATMLFTPLAIKHLGRTLESFRTMHFVAPLIMSAGTATLFIPYPTQNLLSDSVFLAGALITGVGAGWLWIMWGEFHSRFDAERIEVVIPSCAVLVVASLFLVSNLIYPVGGIAVCLLPLLSGFLLIRSLSEEDFKKPVDVMPLGKSNIRWSDFFRVGLGSIMIYVVIGFGWSLISFSSFQQLGQGLELPYLVGAIFGAILSIMSIFYARRLNLFFIYRWMLPVLVCALLLLTTANPLMDEIAYVLIIIAQIAFDIMIWIYFATVAHKGLYNATVLMGVSRGFVQIGVTSGSLLGIPALRSVWEQSTSQSTVCLILVALLVIVIMFVLNQQESFEQLIDNGTDDSVMESSTTRSTLQDRIMQTAQKYGLSKRETEVFALLARGRSFPFIRDELFLSKSTVETHAKNLYKKLSVHSKQELIDLVDSDSLWNQKATRT